MRMALRIGALGLIAVASTSVGAAEPKPMPEMYAVSMAGASDSKPTRDAVDAFMRKVAQLGQKGRAGRLKLSLGESGPMLGGMCVEFVDDPTAQEALQLMREVRGVTIRSEKCM